MMKRILAVILGFIVFFIITRLIHKLGESLYPVPAGIDLKNPESMKALYASMPAGAFILLLLSYMIGSFAAGFVAGRASGDSLRPPMIVGTLLMFGGITELVGVRPPIWFAVLSIISYVPLAYLGGKLGIKPPSKPPIAG